MIRTSRGAIRYAYVNNQIIDMYVGKKRVLYKSPYSLDTTRYFNNTYPKHFSNIIRFGYDNKKYVPYINNDPDLICSLIDVGKERWLVGDGKAWINVNFYATQNTTAMAKAKLLGVSSVSSYQAIFGARQNASNKSFDICFLYPDKIFFDFSNKLLDNIPLGEVGTEAVVELNKDGGWLNGEKVFESSTAAFTTPSKVAVFGRTDGGTVNTRPLNGAIAYTKFDGDQNIHLYPSIRKINGVETCGMIDVLSGTFYQNAGSGSFTISESQSS